MILFLNWGRFKVAIKVTYSILNEINFIYFFSARITTRTGVGPEASTEVGSVWIILVHGPWKHLDLWALNTLELEY